jgi:uncharacterized membrane protein YphA (DoxX/SURF4 family)
MNPFSDAWSFMLRGQWPIYLFWLLLLGGAALAVYNWRRDAARRTPRDAWMCLARILLGCMWYQQTLWKLPPYYTDQPGVPNTGLMYWMGEMVHNAAFSLQGRLVEAIILPHFYFFAPLVYLIEVAIGVSLIVGVLTRAGAILGGLMAVNLWLGLYRSPAEWPWTYFFLILLQFTFGLLQSGRYLGLDALLVRSPGLSTEPRSRIARLIELMT